MRRAVTRGLFLIVLVYGFFVGMKLGHLLARGALAQPCPVEVTIARSSGGHS